MTFELVIPSATLETIAALAARIAIEQLGTTATTAPPALMTVKEAADYLRCKPQRIYDLTSSGRIPRIKEGSRTLIARDDLDAHLGRVAPALPPAPPNRMTSEFVR